MYHLPYVKGCSLVPSLSARQIFIAYSMKNRRGKSGSKRHDDACRNVTNLTSRISLTRGKAGYEAKGMCAWTKTTEKGCDVISVFSWKSFIMISCFRTIVNTRS